MVEELTPSLGDSEGSPMRYEQFKYGRDETLVLYNAIVEIYCYTLSGYQ